MKKGVLRNFATFTGKHLCQRWTKNGKISRIHKISHFFNDEVTFRIKTSGDFLQKGQQGRSFLLPQVTKLLMETVDQYVQCCTSVNNKDFK